MDIESCVGLQCQNGHRELCWLAVSKAVSKGPGELLWLAVPQEHLFSHLNIRRGLPLEWFRNCELVLSMKKLEPKYTYVLCVTLCTCIMQ